MKVSRRDLLVGSAGVAAGLVFTPVPWKLLGDVSIWTQNWPWIPQPAHGPVETRQSVCTLCAAGCGIRVRMAAGWPVGVSGDSTHPVTKGALCPLAFDAQQLNWHSKRLREVRHRGRAASWADAKAAFAKACSEGPVAIVDGRPGRAASSVFEAFAAKHNGSYQVVLGPESQALLPYAEWSGVPVSALGYDLENARTVVSFGAPLLDGWGTPGRFMRLWSERAAGQTNPQLRLIQIEPSLSRTAARAWRWVPVQEGSEAALAAGLARVLFEEQLTSAKGPVPPMTLAEASTQTGLSIGGIRDLARTMAANRPAVVITADANPAVAVLNLFLGAVGAPGGIVLRGKRQAAPVIPQPTNNSLRAALIDATVPWEYVPQSGAEVFRFAAWDGGNSKADWLLPAPGFLEELTDMPTAPTSAVETYTIAVNLLTPGAEIKSATQFLAQSDGSLPEVGKVIHARCEELFKSRAGTVFAAKPVAVAQLESAQKLEEQLRNGGVWMSDAPGSGSLSCSLKQWPATAAKSTALDWASLWAPPVLPPLAGKLYQESKLREAPARRSA
jgi:hypothetical protein